MPWSGAGGQNIEHPHTLEILSCFFCFKCILVLLATHSSGELCCSAAALIEIPITLKISQFILQDVIKGNN